MAIPGPGIEKLLEGSSFCRCRPPKADVAFPSDSFVPPLHCDQTALNHCHKHLEYQ
jgi:hypothetical protein